MLQNRKKLVVALSVVIIVGTIISIFRGKQVQYSPKNVNNIAGPIVIKAKENIDKNSGSYSITPSVAGNLQIIDNYIIFWPEQDGGFAIDNSYQATFKDYRTVSNKNIKPLQVKFVVTKDADYDKLQKEVLGKYGHFEASFNPFLEKLPYKEDYRFKISYAINEPLHADNDSTESGIVALLGDENNWREKKDNYIVYIETLIFQSQGQSLESYMQDVRRARDDALNWITKQGVDVKKDINYVFIPDDKTLANPSTETEDVPLLLDDY